MLKFYLLFIGFTIVNMLNAQVGINTKNPAGIFHIDGKGNTDSTAKSQIDDVVVTEDGNVGIGILNPTQKLDINGDFRLVDGTQKKGRFLVSDNLGNASWKVLPNKQIVFGDLTEMTAPPNEKKATRIKTSAPIYMWIYITLPPGKWMISFTGTYRNNLSDYVYLKWTLSTSNTVFRPYRNANFSTRFSTAAPQYFVLPISSHFLVEHSVQSTYYLWVEAHYKGGVIDCHYTGEGKLFATPLD